MAHHPCTDTHIIYRRKNHGPFQSVTFSKRPCPVTSCFHLQQNFAFLFSFSNAISSQPDSCHASACFCCFHYWVSGEDYGSCDQSLMFASTAVMTQAKVNQAFWEITLYLPGFLSTDIIAYTNPSLPFCEFFNLLWKSQISALLFPKLHQLSPHLSFCLNLILFGPSLVAFYLDLRTGKWLMSQKDLFQKIQAWKGVHGIWHSSPLCPGQLQLNMTSSLNNLAYLDAPVADTAELCSSGNGEEGEPTTGRGVL